MLNQKMKNCENGGVAWVTWPTFPILEPPWYLGNGWRYKPQILHADWS